jgi:hypothetical protein
MTIREAPSYSSWMIFFARSMNSAALELANHAFGNERVSYQSLP